MLTEPHQSRIGAIKQLPFRRSKNKSSKIKIGEVYDCIPTTWESWKYPFRGLVENVLTNSAVVLIISTHESDEGLMEVLKNRTVVPLKNLEEIQ